MNSLFIKCKFHPWCTVSNLC